MSGNGSSGCSCLGCMEINIASILGCASLGVGAYHGYMDAQGIPNSKENLEWWLTYGPTVVQGGVGAVNGGLLGLICGANRVRESKALEAASATLGTAAGAGLGSVIGAAKGGLETLIGYGVGYVVGSLAK